jgi:hypothetical protein
MPCLRDTLCFLRDEELVETAYHVERWVTGQQRRAMIRVTAVAFRQYRPIRNRPPMLSSNYQQVTTLKIITNDHQFSM